MVLSSLCGKVIHSTHIMTPICSSPSKLIMTWKNLVNKWWGLYRTKMHVPSYLGYMSLFCRACSDAASDSHTMRLIFILKPQRNGFTFGSFSLPVFTLLQTRGQQQQQIVARESCCEAYQDT